MSYEKAVLFALLFLLCLSLVWGFYCWRERRKAKNRYEVAKARFNTAWLKYTERNKRL